MGEGEQYYTDVMDCPVCMANFRAQEIIIFSCGHAVCKDCFRELAQRNSKCPICRAELDVKLRVKLELGDRKVKPKKKSARRTKSLPNLKISRNSARDNNYYKYSANNNNKPTSRSLSRKSKKKKSPVRRALSNNITSKTNTKKKNGTTQFTKRKIKTTTNTTTKNAKKNFRI